MNVTNLWPVTSHVCFKYIDTAFEHIFCIFVFCHVVKKHYLGEVVNTAHLLILYFLSNISAKNYRNWLTVLEVLTRQR